MKLFFILFRTGSIPFSSRSHDLYVREWNEYIDELKISEKLKNFSFFKKDGTVVFGKEIEIRAYIPHKEIFSGFVIIHANNLTEAINVCKKCPVFKRGGDVQIKEIDENYLGDK